MSETWPDKLKITVTEWDIRKGQPAACMACPIARAAKRATGREADVAGRIHFWNLDSESKDAEYLISRAGLRFMRRFDDGERVKPFSFIATRVR